MAYVSLYRKWRSQTFEDLVGQEHITITLKNALKGERLSQAYLFCGPRGTGKTSLARIFAKSINCASPQSRRPCNECSLCRRITEGTSLDVIEIDAASHTQVEKVREFIINKVDFLPAESRYKVYIIDEVHKFSNSSFNALLKTLEEPPEHVIFILATTHPQDLPPTILSRCQRFDFRRIPVKYIEERLLKVAEAEGFLMEQETVALLAEAADGSLRDALVLLEQASSMAGPEINTSDVVALLGITEEATLRRMDEILAGRQTVDALELLHQLLAQGKDLEQLAEDVIGYYRRLLLLKVSGPSGDTLKLSEEHRTELHSRSEVYDAPELLRILKSFLDLREALKNSTQRKLLWEMALIRLTRWQDEPSLDSVRRGLLDLEKRVSEMQGGASQPVKPVKIPEAVPPKSQPSLPGEAEKLGDAHDLWNRVLQAVKKEKMGLFTFLSEARLVDSESGAIVLGFPYKFHLEKSEKEKAYIERKAMEIALKPVSINFRLLSSGEGAGAERRAEEEKKHREFVGEAQSLFGGSQILP
ncbi:MAG: DNA polymerase III subunit gamma/tau [bacterium]